MDRFTSGVIRYGLLACFGLLALLLLFSALVLADPEGMLRAFGRILAVLCAASALQLGFTVLGAAVLLKPEKRQDKE